MFDKSTRSKQVCQLLLSLIVGSIFAALSGTDFFFIAKVWLLAGD